MLRILEEKGIKITYHLLSKSIDELQKYNVLRATQPIKDPVVPGSSRVRTEVEANHNPDALELVRQHVIFRNLKTKEDVNRFSRACNIHPYTHYRSVGMSNNLSSYAQFDIPRQAIATHDEYYTKLNHKLHADNYFTMVGERETISQLDLNYWSFPDEEWSFQVFSSQNSIEEVWDIIKLPNHWIRTYRESSLSHLDLIDLSLIREMNINGKVKPAEIAKYYNKDASTISRRMLKIRNEIMDRSTLFYNQYQFDLTLSQLFIGKARNANSINKFHHVVENLIPFRSTLHSNQRDFIWILSSTPTIASDLAYFLWAEMSELEIINLNIQHGRSWKYPLYQDNYDPVAKSWKASFDYIVNNPLTQLK